MKEQTEQNYERRAGIGIGVSIGSILGTALAVLIYGTTLAALIGMLTGIALGAIVGTHLRSPILQFIWIEFPRAVALWIIVASLVFLVPFSLLMFLLKRNAGTPLLLAMIVASSIGFLIDLYTFGRVISRLDDLLKRVLLESFAIGFAISLSLFFTLGLVNLAFPFPSDWMIVFIIMCGAALVGRFVVALKYR